MPIRATGVLARLLRWAPRSRLGQAASLVVVVYLLVSLASLLHGLSIYEAQTHFLHLEFADGNTRHPIERLVVDSHAAHQGWLKRRTLDLHTAADLYRERRGRHPPPGFDAWFRYAQRHNAVVVESFFDRIDADIAPFWGLDHAQLANSAALWHSVISVRDGIATATGKLGPRNTPFLNIWADLVSEAGPDLPDLNMPINNLDEPRVMMPWQQVNDLMSRGHGSHKVLPVEDVEQHFTSASIPTVDPQSPYTEPAWQTSGIWNMIRQACPEGTGGRDTAQSDDMSGALHSLPSGMTQVRAHDYTKNFTAAKDVCHMPQLSGAHAQLIRPSTMMTTADPIPMFSGCKMLVNNDILIPGAAYLGEFKTILPWSTPHYNAKATTKIPWRKKAQGIFWRGISSGGLSSEDNWHRFQRFRLVEMLNGTYVSRVEQGLEAVKSFELPTSSKESPGQSAAYPDLAKDLYGKLGPWLESHADAGFTRFFCERGNSLETCAFLQPHFGLRNEVSMSKQFRYKFLPDTDGNSYSGRYRSFLLSTSLPIKSTLFAEWHDDRLLPWLHFVPSEVDNQDLYAILHYFTRDDRGDRVAQFIAEQGAAWAARVLRREDMLLYVWRVLLEWARVCDENRERLGFVGDLM
ncbi:beta-1,2-xylosyltransferase [Microdochium nivale]|nr:beta-1,2-xylosyltransferase [Microdochium nivale]